MEALRAAGAAPAAARAHSDLLARAAATLLERTRDPDRPACAFVVPGRIELFGKHTDYAGGRSLLTAVDRGLCFVAAGREDAVVTLADLVHGSLRISSDWSAYPEAVIRRLLRAFPESKAGADVVFGGDLPQAAGLSSSSALVTGALLSLAAARGLPGHAPFAERVASVEDLAELAAAMESGAPFRDLAGDEGVGTRGGSEDHTAILCALAGHAVQYSFAPVRRERVVALPGGWSLAVAASGVVAEKAGAAQGAYNRVSEEARTLAALARETAGGDAAHLAAALAAGADAPARLRRLAEQAGLLPRLEQFLAESGEIVPAAADALARGDAARLGELAARSMALAESALRNQVPETLDLVRSARDSGSAAASAFGAGFGGSVWALVEERSAAAFLDAWRGGYLERWPERRPRAAFFLTSPAPPAFRAA